MFLEEKLLNHNGLQVHRFDLQTKSPLRENDTLTIRVN